MIDTLVINVQPGPNVIPAVLSRQLDALAGAVMRAVVEHETKPQPQSAAINAVVPKDIHSDPRKLQELGDMLRGLVHPRKINIAVMAK